MAPDALVNFGACPVVSCRLMIAHPIARRLSHMSCNIVTSGCGSGGSREIDACSSANANGAAGTKLSSTQQKKFRICMVNLQLYCRLRSGGRLASWEQVYSKPGSPWLLLGVKRT